jgi:hypothetical protein
MGEVKKLLSKENKLEVLTLLKRLSALDITDAFAPINLLPPREQMFHFTFTKYVLICF